MSGNLKKLLEADRIFTVACVVKAPEEGGDHWRVSGVELLVHVISKTRHAPIWARCGGNARLGRGLWMIPGINTEVVVAFDNGDVEGDAFIVGVHGAGVPGDLNESTTILVDDSVKIMSAGGSTEKLVKLSEFNDLVSKYNSHSHTGTSVSGGAVTTIATETQGSPASGTSVLEAE